MNHLNLRNVINEIVNNSKEINDFILKIGEILLLEADKNEYYIINEIIIMLSKYKNHPQLIELLANSLNLSNNPDLYQQFEIEELKILYDSNVKNQTLSSMFDQVYFYWNVLDDEESTKSLITKYKKMLEDRVSELNNLLLEIGS